MEQFRHCEAEDPFILRVIWFEGCRAKLAAWKQSGIRDDSTWSAVGHAEMAVDGAWSPSLSRVNHAVASTCIFGEFHLWVKALTAAP